MSFNKNLAHTLFSIAVVLILLLSSITLYRIVLILIAVFG